MISFFICLLLLIGGYFVYGKVVENTFAPDDMETVSGTAPQYCRLRTNLWCDAGCFMGTGCILMDYFRYNICRRCT